MSQWKIIRDPWRYWGQLTDPPPQGLDDRNRQNNCGAECTSMLLEYVTGVELSAAVIKDMMRGDEYVGYLSWGDMAYFWSRFCATKTMLILFCLETYNSLRAIPRRQKRHNLGFGEESLPRLNLGRSPLDSLA